MTAERAIEVVAQSLQLLRTRDGIAVSDAQLAERARNAVTALEGEFGPHTDPREAAVAVAALLADPLDPAARAEARLWLKAWQAAHPGRPSTSTTTGAAKGRR
jgi:hypothetical protein